MKSLTITLILLLLFSSAYSQITTSGNWSTVGDVNLSIINDDANNGDGVGDGAIYVDGRSVAIGQGVTYTFSDSMTSGNSIMMNTYVYNRDASYVRLVIQLYNATDNIVLSSSPEILIANNTSAPLLSSLFYTTGNSDFGDELQVRYIRTDDGNMARNFAIDNLSINNNYVSLSLGSSCPFVVTPDLALATSNSTIDTEISTAIARFSDDYLGTSAPSASELSAAETDYAALNINVSNGVITGNTISTFWNLSSFLKVFAQHLKFYPEDLAIAEKANNAVWWVSKQFCLGTLSRDINNYAYRNFARPVSLLENFLDENVKDLFSYTLFDQSSGFKHFWDPVYDEYYQQVNGAIDTDIIYNISDAMMAYASWYDSADERYRYMRAYKRFIDRFFSYTVGTSDGIKPDGSGFHHWSAYNGYMYAYQTAANIIYYLKDTRFQVDESSYLVFRDAVYLQYMQANDEGLQAFSTCGRNPQGRFRPFFQSNLKKMAIAGGSILGLNTVDTILAGMYNRIYGIDSDLNYSEISPFTEGFFQFNHSHSGAFRKDNWIAFTKGFSNNMWGSEIYTSQNRYGRYQSYGALEIIYPGYNGYEVNTWDWNYNPGTTVIKLDWNKLHAERGRIDELQQKRMVGALSLANKNSDVLKNNHGDFGMFSMDFREREGLGWSTVHSSNNHNDSFTFKKSNFFFEDIIVCLGSNITNDDNYNNTITTLYQRMDNTNGEVVVNGTAQSSLGEINFTGAQNNWVLNNYNTGFYLFPGAFNLKVKKENQQNPNQNQVWPVDYNSNPTATYYTGYLDHGTIPNNSSYEYIVIPNTNITEMQAIDAAIQSNNKPYEVHQQDQNAHIVEHIGKEIWAYAFFSSVNNISYDYVTNISAPCLLMTKYNSNNNELQLAITDPDIGFNSRDYTPAIIKTKQVTIAGEWMLNTPIDGVQILSSNALETVIEFTLVDGLAKEVLLIDLNTLGDEDINLNKEIFIYPNPSKGLINFSYNEPIKIASVFSVLGEKIGNYPITNNKLFLKNIKDGVYFLKIFFEENTITKQIIIKN